MATEPEYPNAQTVEEIMDEVIAVPATPKLRKSPAVRPATRTIEELREANPKSMSPAEATKLILEMRDENMLLQNRLQEMTVNAQKAYEQFRMADQNYNKAMQLFNSRMQQMKDMTRVFHMSVNMLGGNPNGSEL